MEGKHDNYETEEMWEKKNRKEIMKGWERRKEEKGKQKYR